MTRLRFTLVLAAAIAALAAAPAGAYEHRGQQVGSQVLPQHWNTLPIALTVDNLGDQHPARDQHGDRHMERRRHR